MTRQLPALDAAIRRAQDGMFGRQSRDGAWRTCDRAGPPSTGWALAALGYLGALAPHGRYRADGAVRFITDSQLPSGAFPDYPSDPKGSLVSTSACYAGLYAAGVDPRRPEMDRAW